MVEQVRVCRRPPWRADLRGAYRYWLTLLARGEHRYAAVYMKPSLVWGSRAIGDAADGRGLLGPAGGSPEKGSLAELGIDDGASAGQ